MEQNIIGRRDEKARLKRYIASERSEFVAIYGRRRIGKTFLVKELFDGQFAFRMTGKEGVSIREQLTNFYYALSNFTDLATLPTSWDEAFALFIDYLKSLPAGPKILFFDEMPWMDTQGSGFVGAIDHFWNDWASYRDDIKLIVCGSATTWMLDKVINSRGGLHNRVTHQMLIAPFSLSEVEQYFQHQGFQYQRSEIIECYMAVGGVAYYLSLFENDKSIAQNIESLCFTPGGELVGEFQRLFRSLFKKPDNYLSIITALSSKGIGMTRLEIIEKARQTNNGNLTKLLRELEECDFIRSYTPYGKAKKDALYQLIDPFTLFYFHFIDGHNNFLRGHWLKLQSTDQYRTWCGHAFEVVCLHHIEQIVKALGIDGTINTPCSWSYRPSKTQLETDDADPDLQHGTQIDLLIDRSDKTINVCEIKYSQEEYEITRQYDAHISQRLRTFRKVTKTRKTLVPVFITPYGLLDNAYSRRMPRQVIGDQLFA